MQSTEPECRTARDSAGGTAQHLDYTGAKKCAIAPPGAHARDQGGRRSTCRCWRSGAGKNHYGRRNPRMASASCSAAFVDNEPECGFAHRVRSGMQWLPRKHQSKHADSRRVWEAISALRPRTSVSARSARRRKKPRGGRNDDLMARTRKRTLMGSALALDGTTRFRKGEGRYESAPASSKANPALSACSCKSLA